MKLFYNQSVCRYRASFWERTARPDGFLELDRERASSGVARSNDTCTIEAVPDSVRLVAMYEHHDCVGFGMMFNQDAAHFCHKPFSQ